MSEVSHAIRPSDYFRALTAPGAPLPAAASLVARLPIAMGSLALMLYLIRVSGSVAVAGAAAAGVLVGVAIGSVIQGRLIDRYGATRPLLIVAGLLGLFTVSEVWAIESGAPTWLLLVVSLAMGLAEPQVAPAARALWTRLLPPGQLRNAAYNYEAMSMEVFFIAGPALAGALAGAHWAGTGLVVASGLMMLGAVLFALTPAVRRWRPERRTTKVNPLGSLAFPGMRTAAIAAFGFGITIGFIEVAAPAAAAQSGHIAISGALMSVFAVSSVLFGFLYGLSPWPRSLHLRIPVLVFGFALGAATLAIPTSLWGIALALAAAGAFVAPQATTHSAIIDVAAPRGTEAEAFGWVVTSVTLGLAAGNSLGGQLVELSGTRSAFLAGALAALLVSGVLYLRRHTLQEPAEKQNSSELVDVAH
ncbi:MFS transporter [Pseudonocardiaceae bacterium YIM PH 21723]|nr:MFS transporter [Pseudonocardiaceae bacterium YIM PH 21723]